MRFYRWGAAALLATSVCVGAACGDDDEVLPDAATPPIDAATAIDAPETPDAAVVDPAVRGEYIVNHLAVCVDCHTPRLPSGALDEANLLSGAECFIDIDPGTDGVGCLHTPNLTNHATGLMNRTDQQIKDMFLDGMRPNGDALHSVMPYWQFHNMTDDDATAVVAYLRTVTGVDHQTPALEPPWNTRPASPATAVDLADVPSPDSGDPNFDSATRGRYLASVVSVCLECHTPELDPGTMPVRPIDMTRPFDGGRVFPLPSPPFPASVTSSNLTSHATGLEGWTAEEIVAVIKMGVDDEGDGICPPMPAGPMGSFAGMTDDDALDIANYLLSLPAIDNAIAGTCTPPGP